MEKNTVYRKCEEIMQNKEMPEKARQWWIKHTKAGTRERTQRGEALAAKPGEPPEFDPWIPQGRRRGRLLQDVL